jgi:hypothetical protein
MDNNFHELLVKNGFNNIIKPLKEGGIFTLQALRFLQFNDLVTDLNIGKMAAKALLTMANDEKTQTQLVILPPEAIIAINEAQNAITNEKHQHEIELLKSKFEADLKIQALKSDLKMEKLKREIEEVKVAEKEKELEEEKRKNSYSFHLCDVPLISESVLLNQAHHQFLQNCLPSPRTWILLYRGTRDGFSANSFHSRCNRSGPTITIVKSKYLFGGYNPNSWSSSNNYQSARGSFLFCLTNAWSNSPIKFPWCKRHGPFDSNNSLPTFGSGHDLYISNNCNTNHTSYTNFPSSYQDKLGLGTNTFAGSRYFQISEIEVFKLI